jgi:hypothetical protein
MKRYAIPIILLLLLTSACQYKDVVKADNDFALSMHSIQTSVLLAYESNPQLLDKELKDKIFTVCLKVDMLGKQVHTIIVSINKIDPTNKKKILDLLAEISKELDPTALSFIVGIKNPAVKIEVETGFVAARTAISTIQIVLGAQKGTV